MSAKKTTKKTAAKKAAKKSTTTAAKAFEAALGLTAPKAAEKPTQADVDFIKATYQPPTETPQPFDGGDADDYQEYGALGGQDEAEIVERILGPGVMNVSEAPQATQEAPQEESVHTVPETVPDAPQGVSGRKKAMATIDAVPLTNKQAADCVEALIDGLNHLYGLKPKKLLPKDITILQQRVAKGRRIIAQLRA